MRQGPCNAARNLFIRRWGEMRKAWGISRSMAELHALLYLSSEPLCTDDIIEQLSISRGSASTNLRELGNWGLVHRVHRRGHRKKYFEAEKDVWQMFETIMRERRRREVLPIMETIERCLTMIDEGRGALRGQARKKAELYEKRYIDLLEFCEIMNTMFDLMSRAGRTGVKTLAKALGELAD